MTVPLEPRPRRKPVSRLTPEQRRMRARLAAQARWSRLTPAERVAATQPARDAYQAQLEAEPNPTAARAAHMARMTFAASKKRAHSP